MTNRAERKSGKVVIHTEKVKKKKLPFKKSTLNWRFASAVARIRLSLIQCVPFGGARKYENILSFLCFFISISSSQLLLFIQSSVDLRILINMHLSYNYRYAHLHSYGKLLTLTVYDL